MAVFSTSAALLRLILLLAGAGLLAVSAESAPTITLRAASLAMTPQTRNIIDALIGTSDFGSWAAVLNGTDAPSPIPLSATFFVPTDKALSRPNFQSYIDQSTFLYHILPQGLSLFDLQQLEIGDRLPTLLPNNTILITNNSQSNFTIDDCRIIRPDMLSNGFFTLHGIDSVLNYSLYGRRDEPSPTSSDSPPSPSPSGNLGGVHRSDAPRHPKVILFVVYALLAVFMSKL
ncbi:hypothetical protein ACLOJK_017817 [Asimina triloba]